LSSLTNPGWQQSYLGAGTGEETLDPTGVVTVPLIEDNEAEPGVSPTLHMLHGSPEPQAQPPHELPGLSWGLLLPSV